jgi:mannose-6-phosphate isomerase-like protein (cupin superfamily)
MSKKYKYTVNDAKQFNKHGVDLTVFNYSVPDANVVLVSVEKGHFQEFYDVKSHFIYYIVEGEGSFYLDNERIEVSTSDMLVIPPKTRIHYFGKMKLVLTVAPAFVEKNERHVRFVDESESPYLKGSEV